MPKTIDKLGTREALELAAGFDAKFFQFSLGLLADSPDFAHWQVLHELGHLLPVSLRTGRLACLFRWRSWRSSLLGPIPAEDVSFVLLKDRVPDHLRQRSGRARVRGDIEVSFVERERFDY